MLTKKLFQQKIHINHEKILPVGQLKYLGVTFTQGFNFIAHINNIIKKIDLIFWNLKHLLSSNFIEPKFKTFIYKTYIRPIIQYGCQSWLNPTLTSSHQVERLRLLERKILRKTTNTRRARNSFKYINNSRLYDAAKINRIDRFLVSISIKFFKKCTDSENEFIRGLVEPFSDQKFFHPSYINHFHDSSMLFTNDRLLLFHRGFRNNNAIVYNVNQ